MDMPVEGVFHNLVITKIRKEYAGQGQKVMNAMWGAGQMMFNKILIMTDGDTPLQDYLSLARYVFRNCNVARDVGFSAGPMDVLDHSCSALGFGGKMCMDGTAKSVEESDPRYTWADIDPGFSYGEWLKGGFGEIVAVNDQLLQLGIPCLVVAVQKTQPRQVRELHTRITAASEAECVKMILYVEDTIDPNDLGVALWRFCNNLDPKRDQFLIERPRSGSPAGVGTQTLFACLGLDGTIKTKSMDGFGRDWPNIIVADDATIESVDQKWAALGIGAFIPSPSLHFKSMMYGEEAAVDVV
jgi:4-hydroxy-3-polyprenylbenzoate decarboxylase